MTFFWKPATGVKADINRHREKARDLQRKIDELEAIDDKSEMDETVLRTYRQFLYQLETSKAEVVTKIGKK